LEDNEFDLLEIIRKLWKKKFFLISCIFIPAIIAMVVSLLIPKRYSSSATILAPEVASGGGIIQTPFGGISSSGLGQSTISSQAVIALLKSDKMLGDAVDHFNLVEELRFEKKRLAMEFLRDEMSSIEFAADEGIIKISVWAFSPEKSKEMVEFYLANLENLNRTLEMTTQSPVVKVISSPFVPDKKSFPRIKLNMVISGFLGLIVGLLFIYFKEKT